MVSQTNHQLQSDEPSSSPKSTASGSVALGSVALDKLCVMLLEFPFPQLENRAINTVRKGIGVD